VRIGELHHALLNGAMKREEIYGELGEIVVGKKSAVFKKDQPLFSTAPVSRYKMSRQQLELRLRV
jgi:hypothetical protein